MVDLAWREQVNRDIVTAFRANGGAVSPEVFGVHARELQGPPPLLLLHHVGRRSGRRLVTPLAYALIGGKYILYANNSGLTGHPQWYYNVLSNPQVNMEVGSGIVRGRVREAVGDEWEDLHRQLLADAELGAHRRKVEAGRDLDVPILVVDLDPVSA